MTERTQEQVRTALAESNRQIAHITGKMEAIYEGLPRDETAIADLMQTTGCDRERAVAALETYAAGKITALRDQTGPAEPTDGAPSDPAVKRFRELLADGAA